MKITINVSQFRDEFLKMGRKDSFSYEGLGILFDCFEECYPDSELDVIDICCEYSEDTPESIAENYSVDIEGMDDSEILDAVTYYLNDHTMICGLTESGDIVYQQF